MKRLMLALMTVCCIEMSMLIWKIVQDARSLDGNRMRVMVMSLGRKEPQKGSLEDSTLFSINP